MFDVGFSELLVIALVGLIVLGPKRLPEVARTAGTWVARFRRFVADVKQDFDRELQHADLAELQKLKQELDETRRVMEETSSRLMQQASIVPSESADAKPNGAASTSSGNSIAPVAPAPPPTSTAIEAKSPRVRRSPKRKKKTVGSKNENGRTE